MPLPPAFIFAPRYKERPWGAQAIARLGAHPPIPAGQRIGESWEISDREGDESVIADGPWRGKTLRELLDTRGAEVMRRPWPKGQRFPLLVKILDCAERLSLQVHPPPAVAAALGGEPKTEAWYLLDAAPGAALLAGFRRGTTRAAFARALRSGKPGEIEAMISRLPVRRGDAIFTPSGRIHAIDAGCLILEVQQNSDTTYRVYDWGRVGLDGRPRALHLEESLCAADFEDVEPLLAPLAGKGGRRVLADCAYFRLEEWSPEAAGEMECQAPAILHAADGACEVVSPNGAVAVPAGATALLPAGSRRLHLASTALLATVGEGSCLARKDPRNRTASTSG
ncbi:MAG: class I mannose-6-phosphate isomerase [Verrucomicrobiae bacterium]|nr:class I mannose-6-phosphate isomerase [Verrucomicrobiae bacterium]